MVPISVSINLQAIRKVGEDFGGEPDRIVDAATSQRESWDVGLRGAKVLFDRSRYTKLPQMWIWKNTHRNDRSDIIGSEGFYKHVRRLHITMNKWWFAR